MNKTLIIIGVIVIIVIIIIAAVVIWYYSKSKKNPPTTVTPPADPDPDPDPDPAPVPPYSPKQGNPTPGTNINSIITTVATNVQFYIQSAMTNLYVSADRNCMVTDVANATAFTVVNDITSIYIATPINNYVCYLDISSASDFKPPSGPLPTITPIALYISNAGNNYIIMNSAADVLMTATAVSNRPDIFPTYKEKYNPSPYNVNFIAIF